MSRQPVIFIAVWMLAGGILWAGPAQTEKQNPLKLVGMRGFPPVGEIDRVQKDGKKFLPFIDQFGQYRHRDWPGKADKVEDIKQQHEQELADLKKHPGPDPWDRYGGWAKGPKLKATGFFRVEKKDDKWWLVDPEGRLFWSHGIDCVHWYSAVTPISHREGYFQLPKNQPPFDRFYGHGGWAPHGFYKGKGKYEAFNFSGLNLYHKYGDDWAEKMAEQAHVRLRSWGINTLGNWTAETVYNKHRTPYVVSISFSSPPIQASNGYWGQFPDPFHPDFRNNLRKRMDGEKNKSAGDPWCIGYFVGNELSWGKDQSLTLAVLKCPPDQPAKKQFLEDLERKYKTIDRLNRAWKTDHKDWQALANHRNTPDAKRARADLEDFETKLHDTFFKTCREEVLRIAPQQMYMGCRFASTNDRAIRSAARFCHVVSFNKYEEQVVKFGLPNGVDKPIIIGEFHFGALDRGMFHTGLRSANNQADRAATYRRYVRSALNNPLIVGVHWFQYGDQATTGRGDGENYQIGFVDVCDRPYAEMIEASRKIGDSMYQERAK